MSATDHREPFSDDLLHQSVRPADERSSGYEGIDNLMPALDPAIFSLLLGRIEYLSRELGRAETQRTLVEQHISRLEQQIEKLTRQQGNSN
jgi:hypothetical protein